MTETKSNCRTLLITLKEIENLQYNRIDVIMLHSQKGGPGKTTLSCNLAYELARRGHKTVLIDLDIAQPTIHQIFQIPEETIEYTINDILLGKIQVTEETLLETDNPNLSLILAESRVDYGEGLLSLMKSIQDHAFFILHEMVKSLQKFGYQYVIFDCAPGYRSESVHAATVADARIFVLRPSSFSFEGAKQMLLDIYRRLDINSLNFFVFNQVPQDLSDENARLLEKWTNELIEEYLPNNIEFLGILPISFTIIENCMQGEYIFPQKHPLSDKLAYMIDTVTQNIEILKTQDEKVSGSQKRINLETTEVSTKGE
jgi:MinD-like ATPase involved in chromosome partitioning or flagellar assembly